MPLELGAAFRPRQQPVVVERDDTPQQPTVEDLRSEQLLTALAALQDALQRMPAPVVNVTEPDLSAIVQAVTNLKGSATPEEIARAVVNEISPGGELGMDQVLRDLTDALKKLDFRMQGMAGTGGGGVGASDIIDRATRTLGQVSVTSLPAVRLDSTVSNYVSPATALKVAQGRVWLAGSKQTVSLAAPTSSIVLCNPTGSGVNIQLFHFNVTGTVAGDCDFFHTHSDVALFGSPVTPLNPNHYFDAATSAAVVRAGSGVPSAIDVRSPVRRVNTQSPVEFEGLIILGPGHSFGLRVGGATTDGAFYMNARWIEDPL